MAHIVFEGGQGKLACSYPVHERVIQTPQRCLHTHEGTCVSVGRGKDFQAPDNTKIGSPLRRAGMHAADT